MNLRHNVQKLLIVLGVLLVVIPVHAAGKKKPRSSSHGSVTASAKSHSSHRRATRHKNTRVSARSGSRGRKSASREVSRKSRKVAARPRGQQAIDSARATEIQNALIREKYLDGQPSGTWDARTRDAMVRYQSDNGWQTKVVPDSRALIKLGLGPNYGNLLNAESIRASAPGSPPQLQPGGATAP